MLRLVLPLALSILSASAALPSSAQVEIKKAVFSDHQLFWPGLAGKARPEAKTGGHPARIAHAGQAGRIGKRMAEAGSPIRLAVLPIRIRDYRESLPCDSCHRLSANGMEFFLENYLKDRMHARFPRDSVELIAPSHPLLEGKVPLIAYLDSLELPWDKWLADSGQEVVYRPHDRFTGAETRRRLDRLGGLLGATHLLVPARVKVEVFPQASDTHTGGLTWSFDLALWNVSEGRPEWAMEYAERAALMDLDESLEGHLDRALGKAWDGLASELTAQWQAEPR